MIRLDRSTNLRPMNNNSNYLERGPGEIALFAITFLAVVLIAGGLVT